jgi:adenine C2-methylase RlmN of 23S rRNA A2503 and tRNA A37
LEGPVSILRLSLHNDILNTILATKQQQQQIMTEYILIKEMNFKNKEKGKITKRGRISKVLRVYINIWESSLYKQDILQKFVRKVAVGDSNASFCETNSGIEQEMSTLI